MAPIVSLYARILLVTQRKQTFRNYWFLWLTIIVGLIALLLKWSGGICYRVPDVSNAGGTTPVISCPTQDFVSPITIILIIWLAAMISMMKLGEMIRNLRQGNFGIDILAIVAIGACLYAQEYSAAYVIILMLSSGEALEKLANRRANRELSALIKRRPANRPYSNRRHHQQCSPWPKLRLVTFYWLKPTRLYRLTVHWYPATPA